jgi:Zn-dependent protease/predicted transcriptional regulator
MKWSWRMGSVAGIRVYVHATFVLLIVFLLLLHLQQGLGPLYALRGVLFIVSVFGCILLHELGHALAARKYGIRTRDITLLPIGGVARLERMPEEPLQELWVALAGPLVNVAISALLFAFMLLTPAAEPLSGLGLATGPFAARLMAVNIFLVLFNMLPAFPMDGGRVLRALLATRMDYTKATHIAAVIGQGMALCFGFVGIFGNPMLLFIALFVWIGAAQEASMTQMRHALGGIPVSRAMITEFHTLAPSDRLEKAISLTLAGTQQDFPVTEDGRVVGVLTRNNLIRGLQEKGQEGPVADTMERNFQVVEAGEMLATALTRLQACECHTIPVMRGGQLVGMVTSENLGEFLMIESAIEARAHKRVA